MSLVVPFVVAVVVDPVVVGVALVAPVPVSFDAVEEELLADEEGSVVETEGIGSAEVGETESAKIEKTKEIDQPKTVVERVVGEGELDVAGQKQGS